MYGQESFEGYDEFEQAAYGYEWWEDENDTLDIFGDIDDDFEDYEDDGQPDEYTEWQDVYDGDDWDHGQFDCDY
jgi:hypothetical protein